MFPRARDIRLGLNDIVEATLNWRLWTALGWHDIRQRYRRSTIGPFWLTLSMGINIAAIGLLWSLIFNISTHDFVPHLCLGFVTWYLITGMINEGAMAFIASAGLIRQIRQPIFLYMLWTIWRNLIIFGHNFVVYLAVIVIYQVPVNANTALILVTFPLAILSVAWVPCVVGMISTRYRDIPQIVISVLNILFYVTPIIWRRDQLGARQFIADLNPLTHVVEMISSPLTGQPPSLLNWEATLALLILGWGFTILFFSRFRARVPYWL